MPDHGASLSRLHFTPRSLAYYLYSTHLFKIDLKVKKYSKSTNFSYLIFFAVNF